MKEFRLILIRRNLCLRLVAHYNAVFVPIYQGQVNDAEDQTLNLRVSFV
jgi:hypothetical protein